ncbi:MULTISPECIES: DUF3304 domain-containing protein [Enterobacterales]|nr:MULTISPECIES: DUF3304 domain-containing protein [Enterobacterales]WOO48961.1 DUF3304 domain-containing protein [Hafnia alvei]ODQ06870.1 hypothetical protein BGK50_00010 [Shigella sp. FC130]OEI94265.1 hypothetical protein BHE86_00010 [Shigella sp. FC1655]OEJ07027.1 hypothetical protein BHE89_18650 [Shigella sp. FC1967]WPF03428.1 DUF3304 domain-containing protein [Proteus vulgaris]
MSTKLTRKKLMFVGIIITLLAVYFLFIRQPKVEYLAGSMSGINHVKGTAVNWFKVNGYYAQSANDTCCIMVPAKWTPNQWVKVEWEVDPDAYSDKSPPLGTDEFRQYMKKHKANYRHYQKMVEIPEYDEPCSVKVHFLPCQEVKISLSCYSPWLPEYPIKEPLEMEEPAVCSKK